MLLDQLTTLSRQFSQRIVAAVYNYTGLLVLAFLSMLILAFLLSLSVHFAPFFSDLRFYTKGKVTLSKALSYLRVKLLSGPSSKVLPLTNIDSPYCEKYLVVSGTSVTPVCLIHNKNTLTSYVERVSGNLLGYEKIGRGKFNAFLIENPGIKVGITILSLKEMPKILRAYGKAVPWKVERPVVLKSPFVRFPYGLSGFDILNGRKFRERISKHGSGSESLVAEVLTKRIGEMIERG